MYIETYEKRFEIIHTEQIEKYVVLFSNQNKFSKIRYSLKDIYIKNQYNHLKSIRIRYQDNKEYLIYQFDKKPNILNKDIFLILNIKNINIPRKKILFIIEKDRIEYDLSYFKILIDTNIKTTNTNKKSISSIDIIEFEYYDYTNKEKIEKIISFFQKKKIIDSQPISSTYQKVLNAKN